MKKILIPLPSYGFDPTEAAIPWKLLNDNKYSVLFATPDGKKAQADTIMLTGQRLGIWKKLLMGRLDAIAAHSEMSRSDAFFHPVAYGSLKEADFDGLILPGGHDKAVKVYLESPILQELIVRFFNAQKPVGAICHGVVLAARSIDSQTQKSVLYGRKTTALLKSQELTAYRMTRLWLKDYYLTYPDKPVEEEVKTALKDKKDFINGPNPMYRDDFKNLKRGFALRDGNYLSARWPGDVYNFSIEFMNMLDGK